MVRPSRVTASCFGEPGAPVPHPNKMPAATSGKHRCTTLRDVDMRIANGSVGLVSREVLLNALAELGGRGDFGNAGAEFAGAKAALGIAAGVFAHQDRTLGFAEALADQSIM